MTRTLFTALTTVASIAAFLPAAQADTALLGADTDAGTILTLQPGDTLMQSAIDAPGQSKAIISYKGERGLFPALVFDLDVFEKGEAVDIDNDAERASVGALPVTIEQAGSRFTVLSFDDATGEAQVRIDAPIPAADYDIKTVASRSIVPGVKRPNLDRHFVVSDRVESGIATACTQPYWKTRSVRGARTDLTCDDAGPIYAEGEGTQSDGRGDAE